MEQRRPVKTRKQKRDDERKSSLSGAGDFSEFRKSQNVVAFHQDAARRFAQVIEAQSDEGLYGDDDDLGLELGPPPPLLPSFTTHNSHAAVHSRRTHRAPSPLDLNFVEHDQFLSTSTEWSGITAQPIIGGLVPKMPEQTHIADTPIELPSPKEREKRFPDLGHLYLKDPGNDPGEYAIDELDILQEENETLLEKLREAEKKCEEAEARERFLESQIASLGEGAFQETKVLQRKQEELSRREEALRVARQNRVGKEEVADLHSEIKNLRKVIVETTHKLQDIESEAKSLHTMTHRMILTHEEMEEVVLKRCWLARYWGLAVQYGICADIAGLKYEFWSAFAPLPFEFVISAGQKAKESFFNKGENNSNGWTKSCEDSDYLTEGNIETMLSVEMGLKEMASLKIEDAVMLSMAQQRRPKLVQDSNVAGDPTFVDSFELSKEESNDILFKEAWLTYFWKTARDRQVEDDIAEERLELWTNRIGQSPALQDAVDVERGLIELRKLGIQQQLWEASRTEIVSPSLIETHDAKYALDSENSSW